MIEVEYVKISEINVADYNPRDITDEALEGLRASIRKFKLVQPLLINKRTNILMAGHQRLKAAELEGYIEVPVIYLDLSEEEEKALNYTLNNPKISGYFIDSVSEILNELHIKLGDGYLKSLNISYNPDSELNLVSLNMPNLPSMMPTDDGSWESDIQKIDKVVENLDGVPFKIVITGNADDKDAVLIYLKEKLMETSFEGIHIA